MYYFLKTTHRRLVFVLCLLLGYASVAACIGENPDTEGWKCKTGLDCGNPTKYRCEGDRCRTTCQTSSDCPREGDTCSGGFVCLPKVVQPPRCTDGESRPCYEGRLGTQDRGTCKAGIQKCLLGAWGVCIGQIVPNSIDRCGDKLDDNCNGLSDEGCQCDPKEGKRVCGQTIGLCVAGSQACSPEGKWLSCSGGTKPANDRCDGEDNDCDGQVDEDFKPKALGPRGLGSPCSVGVGACKSKGTYICTADGLGVRCDALPLSARPEICDGIDNDCDGQVDQGSDICDQGMTCKAGVCEV